MSVQELPFTYLNELAKQLMFISSFLGGFSIVILATLIVSQPHSKLKKWLILTSAVSTVAFITSLFLMTKVLLITTEGSIIEYTKASLGKTRTIGGLAFFLGLTTIFISVGISGWLVSKRLGVITTILAIIGFAIIYSFT